MRTYRGMKRTLPGQRKRAPLKAVPGAPGFAHDRYGKLFTTREHGTWQSIENPSAWREVDEFDMPYYKYLRLGALRGAQERRSGKAPETWQGYEDAKFWAEEQRTKKAVARHERRRARKRKTSHARTK